MNGTVKASDAAPIGTPRARMCSLPPGPGQRWAPLSPGGGTGQMHVQGVAGVPLKSTESR